jgi:hypothetical protein
MDSGPLIDDADPESGQPRGTIMGKPPGFFVPDVPPENQEAVYAELAKLSRSAVPSVERRIYSITYRHDGEDWTATVGENLKGVRYRTVRVKGQKVERMERLSDPAIVLAIFTGHPYFVVTNHRLAGNVGSRWENPFMAGVPDTVIYFSTE